MVSREQGPSEKDIGLDADSSDSQKKDSIFNRKTSRRSFLKGAARLGAAAVAFSPEAALAGKVFSEKKGEKTEAGKEATSFDKVKLTTLQELKDDKDLLSEIDEKNLEALIETVEKMDLTSIQGAITEISGVDASRLESQGNKKIGKLHLFSLKEADARKISKGVAGRMTSENGMGNIDISVASCMDKDGKFDSDNFYRIFIHEYNHVLTVDHQKPANESIPWTDQQDLPIDFYEGMTEMMSIKIADQLGYRPEEFYGYPGGNLIGAYFLDQIVENKREVARSYFSSDSSVLKKEMEAALGKGSWDELFMGKENQPILEFMAGSSDDLRSVFRLMKICEGKGIDYMKILDGAKLQGIDEKVEPYYQTIEGKKVLLGISDTKEMERNRLMAKGMVVDPVRPHKYMTHFTLFLGTYRGARFPGPQKKQIVDGSPVFPFKRSLEPHFNSMFDAQEFIADALNRGAKDIEGLRGIGDSAVMHIFVQSEELEKSLERFKKAKNTQERKERREETEQVLKKVMGEMFKEYSKHKEDYKKEFDKKND